MTTQIRIRRGTLTELNTVMSGGSPLQSGELGFTTDSNEVFISDGTTAHLVGNVLVGVLASRPVVGKSGRMYHATDDNSTWVDNGISWVDVSGGISNLDDVSDGSTYGKVLNTYLDTNRPDGVWDGTGKLTGSDIKAHLDNLTKHREINDSGSASTELWSANKISSAIDQAIMGLDFQADVLAMQEDASLNPSIAPSEGDRYIIANSSSLHTNFGSISGIGDGDIVGYKDGSFLIFYDVSAEGEGALVWNRAENIYQKWDGSTWSEFGGLSGVTAGDGLTKSGNTINVGGGNGLTVSADSIAVTPDVSTGSTVAPVAVTANGVGVIIDDDSLGHSGGSISVKKVDGGTFV